MGVKRLRLENLVQPAALTNLLRGSTPDGTRALVPAVPDPQRTVAWRLTFSASQSEQLGRLGGIPFNPKGAVQTAKHAKYAKEQGVVVTKAFTRLAQQAAASTRSGFAWFASFAVPTAGLEFKLARLNNRLAPGLILPVAELNRLRREMVVQLEALRGTPPRWTLTVSPTPLGSLAPAPASAAPASPRTASELIVLVRSLPQLEAALAGGVATLYCELENPKHYRDAVALAHPAQPATRKPHLFVAPPRITKPGEDWMLKLVRSVAADGYLVRNYDHLTFFAGERCIGDFSLNVANPLTAEYRQLLDGTLTGAQLWRALRLRHQLGVTRGSLDKAERPVTVL